MALPRLAVTATATLPLGGRWTTAGVPLAAAAGAAALFLFAFLLIDSTCGDGRAAVFAVDGVPFFNAPAAGPVEPDRVGRSFVFSRATAACATGFAAGTGCLAATGAFFATAGLRAGVSIARDGAGDFATTFFTGAFATGAAFFAGTAFFAAAGIAFFAGAGLAFVAGLGGAFFATTFFATAFFAAGFATGLAAFFTTGFAADFLAGEAAFFAVFFVATSACPSSLEAGKRAVIPCP